MRNAVSAARFGYIVNPLLDLQEQRDKLALAMRVRLGKHGFQLIARPSPGNLQFAGGDIGRGAARDDAGELCFRRRQAERFGEIAAGGPGLGPKALSVKRARTSCPG